MEDCKAINQSYLDTCRQAANAEEKILGFLDEGDFSEWILNQSMQQRIILIAAIFLKEVISTGVWLNNIKNSYSAFIDTL